MHPAAILFSLALCAGALDADPLNDVFSRMDKSAQSFKGMSADLKDDDFAAPVSVHEYHSGTVKFKRSRPGDTRVLIEFTGPNAEAISLEGTKARVYYPKTKEVQEYDISSKRGLIDQYLLLGFGATSGEIKGDYEVSWVGSDAIAGEPAAHIRLIPKSAAVLKNLKQADLWISDKTGYPVQQKFITSGVGDYKLASYSNVKINPALPDKDLRLNPPKGVQIKKVGS
jgi:outer membrane lipoprotein-sorting protein